jgi:hypothetical protein
MKCSYFTGTSENISLDEYELNDIKLIKKDKTSAVQEIRMEK